MSFFTQKFFTDLKNEYIRSKELIPNREKEIEYIVMARNGSPDAMRTILGLCYPVIIRKVTQDNRYRRFSGDFGEFVSEVALRLPGAIADFDITSGHRFITFFNGRIFDQLNKVVFADNLVHVPENKLRDKSGRCTRVQFAAPGALPDANHPSMDMLLNQDYAADTIEKIDRGIINDILHDQADSALDTDLERQLFNAMLSEDWDSAAAYAKRHGHEMQTIRKTTQKIILKLKSRTVLQETIEEIL